MSNLIKSIRDFFQRRMTLYEIEGLCHHFSFGWSWGRSYDPIKRFLTKYRGRWYILDTEEGQLLWKRSTNKTQTIEMLETHIKPSSPLSFVLMTDLDWKVEKKRVKKFKYDKLQEILSCEDIVCYGEEDDE